MGGDRTTSLAASNPHTPDRDSNPVPSPVPSSPIIPHETLQPHEADTSGTDDPTDDDTRRGSPAPDDHAADTVAPTPNFRYGNADIECVRSIQYLGFSSTYNLILKYILSNRIDKASKMADMVLRAIRTTGNASVNLSLNIFDKQISPVVLYGSAIWATPKSFNLLYLDNQDEGVNARSIASHVLYGILHKHVTIKFAHRVGKLSSGAKRRILVSLKYYSDKENILRQSTHSADIRDFREKESNIL